MRQGTFLVMAHRRRPALSGTPWVPVSVAVAAFALGLYTTPADAVDRGATRARADEADAAGIYDRDCAECHGVDGSGNGNGPPLRGVGAAYVDYVVSTGRMPIAEPGDEIERGPVPYDRPTVVALARYVGSFADGGPPIPELDLAAADVAAGGELYRLNCAGCHQAVGGGAALVNLSSSAPALRDATALQVAEAIRVGPFEMPAFGDSAMTDDQVADVSAYVTEVLHDPDNRGGLALWYLGPVPEGAVAIVIGLGALILAAVWIEGRAPRRDREADEAS